MNDQPPPPEPVRSYCGLCTGHEEVWCDICCGFAGCEDCKQTGRLPCPLCVGGDAQRIRW